MSVNPGHVCDAGHVPTTNVFIEIRSTVYMFDVASNFNQNSSSWNVSSVTNMTYMLARSNFDQDIGSWDVSSVTDMSSVFFNTIAFNQDLCTWVPAMNITQPNVDRMFSGATQCKSTSNPDLTADPVTPFCSVCNSS
jgi:surface protein